MTKSSTERIDESLGNLWTKIKKREGLRKRKMETKPETRSRHRG